MIDPHIEGGIFGLCFPQGSVVQLQCLFIIHNIYYKMIFESMYSLHVLNAITVKLLSGYLKEE